MPGDGCPFCGGKPPTIEHVIPNWLGQILPVLGEDGPAAGYAMGKIDMATPDDMQFFVKRFPKGNHKTPVEVRRPCVSCNTGWMHRLENQARPWLEPMILGNGRVRIPVFGCRWVATWAVKTSMMYRYSDSPPVESPEDRLQWLFKHKTPPPGSSVFLGRARFDGPDAMWARAELVEVLQGADGANDKVHLAAVRLGDLALFIVEIFSGNEATLTIPERWHPALVSGLAAPACGGCVAAAELSDADRRPQSHSHVRGIPVPDEVGFSACKAGLSNGRTGLRDPLAC